MAFLLRFLTPTSGGLGIALLVSLGTNYALWNRAEKIEAQAERDIAMLEQQHIDDSFRIAVAASEAQQAAIKRERERWQELLLRSQESAREAQRNRQAAEEEARLLQIQLKNLYETDPDVEAWRNQHIPDALRGVLEDEDHPT